MRRLAVKILVLIALVWGGWWWIASGSVQRATISWMDTLGIQGINTTVRKWSRGGFPTRIAATANDITLSDTATQTTVQIPSATLSSPIHWPGDARIEIPAAPILIATPQGTATLITAGAEAEMLLHAGPSLQLEAMSASAANITLDLADGRLLGMENLQADIQQGDDPATYTVDLTAIGLGLGELLRGNLQLPASWPETFEPIIADMVVQFDRPWDRSALIDSRPQPRSIMIEKVEAIYADLGFAIAGDLTVNSSGVPSGILNLEVRNWKQVFDIMVAITEIPPEWRGTVQQVLGAMADSEGNIDLDITLAQGQMRMGFLPLGSAPRLVIR